MPRRPTPDHSPGRPALRPTWVASVATRRAVIVVAVLIVVAIGTPAHAAELARSTSSTAGHLLTWWKAVILGVVEGITEYLPVSSTGHLLVTSRLLGLPDAKGSLGLKAVNTYAVAIQFGAILAVLGVFWRRFVEMIDGLRGRNADGRHLLFTLVIAFLPSAALGAALDKKIEDTLFGPWPVVVAWIVGGIVILVLERSGLLPGRQAPVRAGGDRLSAISYGQALIIGLAQCFALWPGTSRSLTTIIAALLLGLAMPIAVEFSFLLGFSTLSAATAFKLVKDGGNLVDQFGVINPLIGVLFAFIAAVLAIKWLIAYLEQHDLTIFAWYRFAVAAVAIVLLATSVI